MSNVKHVRIEGEVPFNIDQDDAVLGWLGRLNAPACGFRISYGHLTRYVENETGGKTVMYNFVLIGIEAWSWAALEELVKDFTAAGASIAVNNVQDLEA